VPVLIRNPDWRRKNAIDSCISTRHGRILLLLPHSTPATPWITGSSYDKLSLRLAGASSGNVGRHAFHCSEWDMGHVRSTHAVLPAESIVTACSSALILDVMYDHVSPINVAS